MAPLLNGLTDGGVIDYRQQLDEVIDEELVVEGLVTVLELLQEDVTINIAAQSLKLAVTALGLLLQGFDGRRKASDHAVLQPFSSGKGRPPIRDRVGHGLRFS